MHWYIPVVQVFITYFTWRCYDYIKNRSPINIINGITLPDVNDNRWEISTSRGEPVTGKLGNITFERDLSKDSFLIWINSVWIPDEIKTKRYILEVCREYQKRKALESINETKFLELE